MDDGRKILSYRIKIEGLVQGVGFRPFIYRIAHKNIIFGTVENNNTGVIIIAEGTEFNLNNFINDIRSKNPPASHIENILIEKIDYNNFNNFNNFSIIKSTNKSNKITQVSPDIAVCDDCLDDLKNQKHRINYPLTNCTNCGPRFTIIKDLPYDREKTTMRVFPMCEICESEYTDVLDRRFHAQPVACNNCGPKYKLNSNSLTSEKIEEIINFSATSIDNGEIGLIKGMGGYFLTCDALNSDAVKNLRKLKLRESKPFAVMVKDLISAKKYVELNDKEKELLDSFRKPVVICKLKYGVDNSITNGLNSLGILLPYMPFHYMLFDKLNTDIIVFTSGNLSDEPIFIDDKSAYETFYDKVHFIVNYNREIYNRADDSVTSVIKGRENILRRSRGYVPEPIITNFNTEGIFAAGAELVNTFAIGKEDQVILSQHIGDLKNYETLEFYKESYFRFKNLFKFEPEVVVFDKHPDYLSTKFAKEIDCEKVEVQHHHAHMASCMAENSLDEKVIGIIMDGTGLGDDGNIWGSEFFVGNYTHYERKYHFDYLQLPGGDISVKEPWRIALSVIKNYKIENIPFNIKKYQDKFNIINQMLEKNINSPKSCGAGRYFDAVAALIGLCEVSEYHSQAPMLLESLAENTIDESYSFEILENIISFRKMFLEIIDNLENGISQKIISTKFHNTIIRVIFEISMKLKNEYNINKVVLSGGVFQNRLLTEGVLDILERNDFEVYTHSKVPANDGGIALGQLAIAAKRRNKNVS